MAHSAELIFATLLVVAAFAPSSAYATVLVVEPTGSLPITTAPLREDTWQQPHRTPIAAPPLWRQNNPVTATGASSAAALIEHSPSLSPASLTQLTFATGDPGQVPSPVPLPGALWLFGSGAAALTAAMRRRRTKNPLTPNREV